MPKEPSRRQERKAAEREAAERARRRNANLLRGALIVIVVGVAAFSYRFYTQRQLLEAVTTTNYPAGQHISGQIDYKESPPMGGAHNVAWQNCSIYRVPIHNEHAVHSLEHGAIWITYRPDLPSDQVKALESVAADDYMLLSPYPGLSAPVIASAWNHQIKLDGAADPRLSAFIKEFKNSPQTTPELGAPCVGAISTPATADTLVNPQAGMAR